MSNVIIKYSDFFEDDGGFEKAKQDFIRLGKDLINEAEKIRQSASLFDAAETTDDIEKIEKAADDLLETYKDYGKAVEQLDDIEKQYQKTQKNTTDSTIKYTKELDELFVQQEQYRVALKAVNQGEKEGLISTEKAAVARGRLKLEQKALTQEINKQQKVILDGQKLSRREEKLIQAQITLQKERATTIEEIRERLSALRLVQSQVDITTEEGAKQIQEFNDEINELTDQLAENSDKFIQNKINIGNYEESISSALKSSGLFTTGIGGIDAAFDALTENLRATIVGIFGVGQAAEASQKNVTQFGRSIQLLSRILKASGIAALVAVIGTIASVFSQGRRGAILFEQTIGTVSAVIQVAIQTIADFGSGIGKVFGGIIDSFSSLGLQAQLFTTGLKLQILDAVNAYGVFDDKIAETQREFADLNKQLEEQGGSGSEKIAEGFNQIGEAISSVGSRYDDLVNSITKGNEAIERSFVIADEIRRARLDLVGLEKEFQTFNQAGQDDTISLREQIENQTKALDAQLEVLKQREEIQRLELELANQQARQQLRNARTSLIQRGINVDNALAIKDAADFAEEFLRINESLDPIDNPIDDEAVQASVDALIEFREVGNEINEARLDQEERIRRIQRDLFEQNLDILIDGIEKERQASLEFVNSTRNATRDRIIEFERFLQKFQDNARAEIAEFNRFAEEQGIDIELGVEFDEEGNFQLLRDGVQLSRDDLNKLKDEFQDLKFAEIPIKRLFEVFRDNQDATKEFIQVGVSLNDAVIKTRELQENLRIDESQLQSIQKLNDQISDLLAIDTEDLSADQRQKILDQIQEFEDQKTDIERKAQNQRLINQITALEAQIKILDDARREEEGIIKEKSDDQLNLERELAQARLQLSENTQDETTEDLEKGLADRRALEERQAQEIQRTLNNILDAVIDNQEKRVEATEERVERQEEAVDAQRRRAEEGLANTLAFEERERGKAEAELIKQQERLERQEKIRALYQSYQKNAQNPNLTGDQALQRTLKDFAILEAIAASFGEGGVVEDKLPSDGIFRGRSHQGRYGGIPILVEGKEGILSKREMANLGKDNFYALKNMASSGPIDTNFFSPQQDTFFNTVPIMHTDPRLVEEMVKVRKTIDSKPTQMLNVPEIVEGILTFTETVVAKNKVKRNHYKINKRRI